MTDDPKAMPSRNHKRQKARLSDGEIAQLVEELAVSDLKQRRRAGAAIGAEGERAIGPLLQALDHKSIEVRRSAVFLLGRIGDQAGQSTQDLVLDRLVGTLRGQDAKVRKNSAISLGRLGSEKAAADVIQAIDAEAVDWVRPSLLLALGALGGDAARGYLSSYQCQSDDERRARRKALDRLSKRQEKAVFLSTFSPPLDVLLCTAPGLEDVLRSDVADTTAEQTDLESPGVVRTRVSNMTKLLEVRTFSEMLLPVGRAGTPSLDDIPDVVLDLLKTKNALRTVVGLHEVHDHTLRYRLEIRGSDIKHFQRQRMALELSERIDAGCDLLVNSTSDYDVELRLVVGANAEVSAWWVPHSYPDARFDYRVADVPASISPVIAAGLVRLLQAKGGSSTRVLDPFCGSATLLVERERWRPCEELLGIDISGRAIEAAQQNIGAAQSDTIRLIRGDMRTADRHGLFDEVVTNMPFGLRAGTHEDNVTLYADFIQLLPGLLRVGGQFVLFTHEVSLLQRLLKASKGLQLLRQLRIEAGGLQPVAFAGRRS